MHPRNVTALVEGVREELVIMREEPGAEELSKSLSRLEFVMTFTWSFVRDCEAIEGQRRQR